MSCSYTAIKFKINEIPAFAGMTNTLFIMTKGSINVSVENIFPLIKKFLYSDHEIFLRELISNATDATLKLKHLTSIGEAKVEYGNPQIEIKIDKKLVRF